MPYLKPLRDIVENPSGFDSLSNYSGHLPDPDWLAVMTKTRDSECLTDSNWEAALADLGGESETVAVFRFGHWACGYWDCLAVKKGSPAEKIGEEIQKRLEEYPVLDESDLSEREMEEANRVWSDCYNTRERVAYIRKHRRQFDFRSLADLRAVVRGDYFSGYASELIY